MDHMTVNRAALIGRPLRAAPYTVSEVDVKDFLGVVAESDFVPADGSEGGAEAEAGRMAPPSFAPFVAVLGLLKTFDWQDTQYRWSVFVRPVTATMMCSTTVVATVMLLPPDSFLVC